MSSIRLEWNGENISKLLKDDPGIRNALQEAAAPVLAKNNAEAYSLASSYTSRGLIKAPYAMEVRNLERTAAAVIHSTNKLAARIGRENGLPHW